MSLQRCFLALVFLFLKFVLVLLVSQFVVMRVIDLFEKRPDLFMGKLLQLFAGQRTPDLREARLQ